MPKPEPEQYDPIQAFYRWIESSRIRQPGFNGSRHGSRCHFIPLSAVEEYFGAHNRVEGLLASLFDNAEIRIISPQVIRKDYQRTLAILLLIGKGSMIRLFVQYQSLQDYRLPFRSRPADFPASSDPTVFERFYKEQWQFCATDLKYDMNLRLHKEDILPIIHKEEIGHGGSAVIFKITVHEAYNKLSAPRWNTMPERPLAFRNTFVLKTYRGLDVEDQHKAELTAFMSLRHQSSENDSKPTPFVIAYHGSFVDDDTYNIVLEYADRGNLEEFMKAAPKPSTETEMIVFWSRLCSITHGLAVIHGKPGSGSSNVPILLGWHQDIKPANILVLSGDSSSIYDVHFKLADLGLCHFKPSERLHHDDSDLDAFGTRAYGAPETFRLDQKVEYIPIQVRPDVDIWSTGCVFSEAAVWSRFGWELVLEYRHRRQDEVKKKLGLTGEHIFHDGSNVLCAVQDMHRHITNVARDLDRVTVEIIGLVDSNMLLNEHQPRFSARQVRNSSERVIKIIQEQSGLDKSVLALRKHDDTDLEEPPKTPPSLPPGYVRGTTVSSQNPSRIQVGMISNRVDSPVLDKAFVSIGQRERQSLDLPVGYRNRSSPGSFSGPTSPKQESKLLITSPFSSANNHHFKSPLYSDDHIYPLPQTPKPWEEPERPCLTLHQGLLWKKSAKRLGRPCLLNGRENLTYLNGRDHVFVVDNTESMFPHCKNVLDLLSLLAYLLKDLSPDGLDIYFTQYRWKTISKKSTKIVAAADHVIYGGISDMRLRLYQILEEHKCKLSNTAAPAWPWFSKIIPQRPLSFYIFTDGKWQPNEVGPVIQRLADGMRTNQLGKEQVGIQFIRFGDDLQGMKRLNDLKHGLDLKSIDMDIVDTTPWNGNVWKQLLGAINSWYGNGPD